MTVEYILLKNEIIDELSNIERIMKRALLAYEHFEKTELDRDIYLDSVALNLHSFYSGIEKIFESIANKVDRYTVTGQSWHKDLLVQMNTPIDNVRPPVISKETKQNIQEYLDFRHVVRNVYAYNFDPEKLGRLVHNAVKIYQDFQGEIRLFIDFLDKVGREA